MPMPQPGIFALGTRSHPHLEFDVDGDPRAVVDAVGRVREAATTVAGVNVVAGFGHRRWQSFAPDDVPSELVDFQSVAGVDDFVIPAAQHDLWLWLHAFGPDAV